MAKRKFRFNSKTLFTWFLLGSFAIFLCPQSITGKFQLLFARTFHWPLNLGRNIVLSAVSTQVNGQQSQNDAQLINQIANLQARIAELEKQYAQVAGFRSSYPFEGAKFIQANITRSTNSELIIDRGQKDQISNGLFVFGDNSIIGVIADATSSGAKVKLLSSPSCRLEVKVGTINAVLQGDGKNIKIKTIAKTYSVKTGENVYCQAKTGFLNTPIIIGMVSQCQGGENPFQWDITVKPAANTAALTSVGVIKY
jgi:cell shape-determining protein MreC